MLTDKAKVLAALGGVRGVAELTGKDYGVVENWKRAKSFPAHVHAIMTWALAKQRLRAHPSLWGQVTIPEMEKRAA